MPPLYCNPNTPLPLKCCVNSAGNTDLTHVNAEGVREDISFDDLYRTESIEDLYLGSRRVTALRLSMARNTDSLVRLMNRVKPTEERLLVFRYLLSQNDDDSLHTAEAILKAGMDINFNSGDTPLHLACGFNNSKMVDLFLQYRANPNILDGAGDTALHRAVFRNNTAVIDGLLSHGADCNIKSKGGNTPFERALLFNKIDLAEKLFKKTTIDISFSLYMTKRSVMPAQAGNHSSK